MRTTRRLFLVGSLAAVGAPLAAKAQVTAKVSRIGILTWDECPDRHSVFGKALTDAGYAWGQTVQVSCRSGDQDYGTLSSAATALAAEKLDVIVTFSHIAAYAARRATHSIPIVMIASGDPVRSDLVVSLARPGRNVTGLTYYGSDLTEKRLQLLREIAPRITSVAVLGNPESDHVFGLYRQDTERSGGALGLQLVKVDVRHPGDLRQGFELAVQSGAQGLLVLTDPMLRAQARRIVELAAEYRLPAMYWGPWFMHAGGLAAYSADYDYLVRRTVYYVDRILRGARPGDLPVEQPTTFALMINLRTAKALGLTVPSSVLLLPDQVIE